MYHISDEFFKEVFQKLLGGQQRGLVQLLLPQVIVIVHRLEEKTQDKVSAKEQETYQSIKVYSYSCKKQLLTHIRAQSMSIAACVTLLLFLFKAFTVFTPNFSRNLETHKHKFTDLETLLHRPCIEKIKNIKN